MKVIERSKVRTHCRDSEWPELVARVEIGESFVVETEALNSVNGPVGVVGISAGDAIAVRVEKIDAIGPFRSGNGGPFYEGMGPPVSLELEDGVLRFPRHFQLPLRPSVGNLAVLPRPTDALMSLSRSSLEPQSRFEDFRGWRRIVNDPRGKHCHQDCRWLCAGSTLHVRAQVDQAGICVADVHAYIGEGECGFGGIEVAADVQLRVERSSGWHVDWPLIETADEIMVCCSAGSVGSGDREVRYVDLVREAYRAMREIVAHRINGSIEEANPLVACALDLRNCAIYGMKGYVAEWNTQRDDDLSLVAALPKAVFRDESRGEPS